MKTLTLINPFGAAVYHEETLSSTFDAARILAGKNAPHGTVITADYQETGRGRQGRLWAAERGKNLLFTILLRYDDFLSIPRALTLRTGLAVSLAIEDIVPSLSGSVQVKWPNDIMINTCKAQAAFKAQAACKAAGILTEADGKTVFIGVGVNVSQKEFPAEYRSRVGSIIQVCPGLPEDARFVLLEKILLRLYEEIERPQGEGAAASLLGGWQERLSQRLYKKGELVTFAEGSSESFNLTEGILSGIGLDGELLIIPRGEKTERSFITGELRVYS